MKRSLIALLSALPLLLSPARSSAAPVSAAAARRAVSRWTTACPAAHLHAHMDRPVRDVRTVRADGADAFHVVDLEGGGFVVTAADDRIEPIIAFSDAGTLVEDPENPLWILLNRDLPQRMKAHRAGAVAKRERSTLRGRGRRCRWREPAAAWQELTTNGDALQTQANAKLKALADVRVDALVQSAWGQGTRGVRGYYNYYTPNYYICGCVATAAAQLMRFWQFPTASVKAVTKSCWVDGVATDKTAMGGVYDWANMPLKPSSSGDETQQQAIGRLCYDAGVAARMNWTSAGSGAYDPVLAQSLVSVFGYANAKCELGDSMTDTKTENAIYANLDAGCPVLLGIQSDDGGHEIVADGYGFNDDGLVYTHLNLGWSGSENAWYALPSVSTANYDFNVLSSIVYNVFPDKTGELITGRILDEDGAPVAGAAVKAVSGSTTRTATSNANGIYALNVPSATGRSSTQTWTLTAVANGFASNQSTATVGTSKSTSFTLTESGSATYTRSSGSVGNRWGNDIVLRAADGPVPTELSVRGPAKVCAGTAATYVCAVRYSDGTEAPVSAKWSISGNTTTSGRWFWTTETVHASLGADSGVLTAQSDKAGISIAASATVGGTSLSASLTMAVATTPDPRPAGDAFSAAAALSGTSGSATVDTTNATDESGEPLLAFEASATGTAWWRWTAPGDGTVRFDTEGSAIDTVLGVYAGTALANLAKVAENDNLATNVTASGCEFACQSDTTYYLAVGGYCGARGSVTVNWQATLNPLPALDAAAGDADTRVRDIVGGNPSLAANITTAAAYGDFRNWVIGNGIDPAVALASSDSFLSFALDQTNIVDGAQLTAERIEVKGLRLASGDVRLTVAIADMPVGEQAERQYLEKVFGILGTATLATPFRAENATYRQDMARNQDGSVSYSVTPRVEAGAASPSRFFLRANVTK